MRKVVGAVVGVAGLAIGASVAHAQAEPTFEPSIDLQLFDYAPGPKTFMSVSAADVVAARQMAFDFFVTFLTDPLTLYTLDPSGEEIVSERTEVVENVVAGSLVGAYGINDRFQAGVQLPIVFSMSGQGIDPASGDMATDGLQATGLGDLHLEIKMSAWQSPSRELKLAAAAGLSVPTSFGTEGGDFMGDDLPEGRLRGALQWDVGRFSAGVNAGLILRKPRTIYASEIGQQASYGIAAAVRATDRVSLIGELFGRAGLPELDVDSSPLELAAGARVGLTRSFSLLLGGGGGVSEGIGTPGFRAFAGVGYAPDRRDQDGDGLSNLEDQCPLVAEDTDGFEDSDGCGDPDNDRDMRDDGEDKCPTEAEDLDGFEDEDGCPEGDNDKDGVLDARDRCPVEPEDKAQPFPSDGCPGDKRDSDDDGVADKFDACAEQEEDWDQFEDEDGCPEADNDNDGVRDGDDKCPLCPEDKDGHADEDGCPDLDNDGDGVADARDKCPAKAEVVNGVSDFDGCPDSGGRSVARLDGNKITVDASISFRRDRLKSTSDIDQVAAVILAHPEVARWRVVVAVKAKGDKDKAQAAAQKRADAVKDHLVSRGVAAAAIEAVGAGSDRDLVAVGVLERAEAAGDGAAVCPANLLVKPRPPAARTP